MSEEHEAAYVELIKRSWTRFNEFDYASHVDEMLVGAVISSTVRLGYVLIDLESDGTNHFLRFENPENHERLTFRLKHMTGDLVSAKTLGHLANVTVGYGVKVPDIGKLWSAFKQEMKSVLMATDEPGVVGVDADITAGYLYAQVPMIWGLEEYLKDRWTPDVERLASHIYCAQVSLKKYLDGRLQLI